MVKRKLNLTYSSGLHARPSMALAKIMSEFSSSVHLVHRGSRADAKSILEILSTGVHTGEVVFEAEGPDAEAALQAAEDFFHMLNTEQHW